MMRIPLISYPVSLKFIRSTWFIITALFIFSLTVRLVYLHQIEKNDPYFYHLTKEADSSYLHETTYKLMKGEITRNERPVYTAFLASVYSIAHNDKYAGRLIQFVLGALQAVFFFFIGSMLFTRRSGIISALIVALYAPFVYYEGQILIAPLQVFFMSLIVFFLICAEKKRLRCYYLFLGIVIGLMSVDRSNILLFVPCYLAFVFWRSKERKKEISNSAVMIGGVILPYIILSSVLFALTGSASREVNPFGVHIYRGNAYGASGMYLPLDRLEPVENNAYLAATVKQITEHPFSWIALTAKKTKFFLWYYELPNNVNLQFDKEHYAILRYSIPYGILLPLAILGMIVSIRKNRAAQSIFLLGTVYAVSIILFFITARYRLPVVPALIPFAALCVDRCVFGFRELSRQQRLLFGCGFVALVVFVNTPTYDTFLRTIALAKHYREWGMYDKAERMYKRAYLFDQDSTEPFEGLAELALIQGKTEDALKYVRKGLSLDREDPELRLILGRLYLDENKCKEAYVQVMAALKKDPVNPHAYFTLGELFRRKGNIVKARKAFLKSADCGGYSAELFVNIGALYLTEAMLDEARQYLEQALDINPRSFEGLFNMALVYYSMNDYEEARTYFRMAEAQQPDYPDISTYLRAIQSHLKD